MRRALQVSAIFVALAAVSHATELEEFVRPLDVPFPANAPYDPMIATLGKMLYFDPRLSGGQNMSCASCHNPSFGWETPVEGAIGSSGQPLARHAPTVLNLAWTPELFWDGRASSLEEQAEGPITHPDEMNATMEEVVDRLSDVPEYDRWFQSLFPDQGITRETILTSIATFERTIISGWAPFDRWVEGDEDAISEEAKRGFELFTGRAGCVGCHTGWNFTDDLYHDIGLWTEDLGRGALEPDDPLMQHAFKTPGLRNIAMRAPFMHHGEVATLDVVIAHYAGGGIERPSLSPLMQSFELRDGDIEALVAFLETLTEESTDVPTPVLPAN